MKVKLHLSKKRIKTKKLTEREIELGMDFVSIAKFVVKWLDLLAWPLLSVVYPLCASIRTIESDSNSDPKKLVAYWILFSLIFLFEHAFVRLLQWVPFWPYIKMIISFLLVIPNFDGAFYVYQHFLRPCLLVDTNFLLNNQFKQSEEFVTKGNNLATEVKRYVKENGPQPLEVASEVKVQSANNFVEKVTEKKDVDAAKQVTRTEPGLSQTESKKLVAGEIKEISDTVEAVRDFCEIPVTMRVQREWTCAICQVTTQSETTLNSHLRGRRHRETCKELKEKNQPSKTKNSASEHKKSDKTVQEVENGASTSSRRQSRRQRKLQQQQENIKYKCVDEHKQSLFWCRICNRSCNSKHDMQCHLKGRKHLAQVAQLKGGT
ncbi:hypothetical protein Pint_33462 [Pistacia integerrima]|uniref:Uncharacterized protein n=1 Tax=Pistacia integerrima TaxID=434235 RepID=A0ACC0X715_9ROSI|nr:hypothetical protein Pint_33462 [Pistacia integerrima]